MDPDLEALWMWAEDTVSTGRMWEVEQRCGRIQAGRSESRGTSLLHVPPPFHLSRGAVACVSETFATVDHA